ncbi:MAG: class I adenylate-forming enzyme family protein, partial [Candidatus Sericytochromatia bacterium]
ITFSELGKNAFELAQYIKNTYSSNNNVFLPANRNIQFLEYLLALILSGNIPIVINPNINKNDYSNLKNQIKSLDIAFENLKKESFIIDSFKIKNSIQPSLALLTSGSEGTPKIVLMSHEGIFNNVNTVIKNMNLENPNNVGIILPLYHSFALITQLFTTLVSGGNIFISDKITFPKEIEDFIINNNINTFAGVPSNFRFLISNSDKIFSEIKHITCAGAGLEYDLAKKIKNKFPNTELWVGYGLTVAGPRVTAINYNDSKFEKHSVGKAIENTKIEIIDEEIVIESNSIMLNYLNDPSNNKVVNGKLFSGDTGYIDQEGYLYITGRKDNVFSSNGEKIYPQIIENVLNSHESIIQSAVYGKNCDISGNRIVALVKLKDSTSLNKKELIQYCRKKLDSYMIPFSFIEVKELPMTENGKIK